MRHSSLSLVALVSCLVLSVGACKKIEEPKKAPVKQEQQQPVEPAATQPVEPPPATVQQDVAGQRPALPPLFKDIETRTFQFFWDTTKDRKSVGSGQSVSVRVALGGRRIMKQNNKNK